MSRSRACRGRPSSRSRRARASPSTRPVSSSGSPHAAEFAGARTAPWSEFCGPGGGLMPFGRGTRGAPASRDLRPRPISAASCSPPAARPPPPHLDEPPRTPTSSDASPTGEPSQTKSHTPLAFSAAFRRTKCRSAARTRHGDPRLHCGRPPRRATPALPAPATRPTGCSPRTRRRAINPEASDRPQHPQPIGGIRGQRPLTPKGTRA